MTAADVQAIAESATAITAAGAVAAWFVRTSRRYLKWRRRRRRDQVLNYVIPACMATLVVAAFLFQSRGGGEAK